MLKYPRVVSRDIKPTIRRVAGGGILVLLSVLFYLTFYQNLPANPLNDPAPAQSVGMGAASDSTGNTTDRTIRLIMIAITVSVITTRWSLVRVLAKSSNPGLAAFMVLAPLSAIWSIDPSATLLRFTSFACVVLVCFAISLAGWYRQRLQQLAIPPVLCILVASLVLGIMYPDRIIEVGTDISQNGAWHGITFTKNTFGMLASAGVILCLNKWLAREGRAIWSIAGTAVAFVCLVLSRSNTSLLAALVGILFMVLVMRVPMIKKRYSTHVVIGIVVTLLLYEMVIQDVIPGVNVLLAPITGLTGKDTTFSARTTIWNVIKEHIRAAPLLGTGYSAYWQEIPSSPSYVFKYLMYFYPSESHNGYLEVMNDLGLVGMLCLLSFIYSYVRYALQMMQFDRSQASLYLAIMFSEMVINMSESNWFSRGSTSTILILATFCLSRGLFEHHRQAQSTGSVVRAR